MKKAKELLQLAKAKTRPGSGYHLGPESSIGLPAVCAYIASQESVVSVLIRARIADSFFGKIEQW